jgi:hypothetical protein
MVNDTWSHIMATLLRARTHLGETSKNRRPESPSRGRARR